MPAHAENPQRYSIPEEGSSSRLIRPTPFTSQDFTAAGIHPIRYEELYEGTILDEKLDVGAAEMVSYVHYLLKNKDAAGIRRLMTDKFWVGMFRVERKKRFEYFKVGYYEFPKALQMFLFIRDFFPATIPSDSTCHRYEVFGDETGWKKLVILAGKYYPKGYFFFDLGVVHFEPDAVRLKTSGLVFFHLIQEGGRWKLEGIEHLPPNVWGLYPDLEREVQTWRKCPPPEVPRVINQEIIKTESTVFTTLAQIKNAVENQDIQSLAEMANIDDLLFAKFQTEAFDHPNKETLKDSFAAMLERSTDARVVGYQAELRGRSIASLSIYIENIIFKGSSKPESVVFYLSPKDGRFQINMILYGSGVKIYFGREKWMPVASADKPAVLLPGGTIEKRWQNLNGEKGILGKLREGERLASKSKYGTEGIVARFENGDIYWSPHGVYEVTGPIRDVYEKYDGPKGFLGYPTRSLRDWDGIAGYTKRQDFEGGFILTNQEGKVKVYRRYVIFLRGVGSSSEDETFSALQQDSVIQGFTTEWRDRSQYLYFSYNPNDNHLSGTYDQEHSGKNLGEKLEIALTPKKTVTLAKMLHTQIFEHYQANITGEVEPAYVLIGHSNGGRVAIKYLHRRTALYHLQPNLPFIDSVVALDSPLADLDNSYVGQVIRYYHPRTPVFTFGALEGIETCNVEWLLHQCQPGIGLPVGTVIWTAHRVDGKPVNIYWLDDHDTILENPDLNRIIQKIVVGKAD